jgi:hypothetical protein
MCSGVAAAAAGIEASYELPSLDRSIAQAVEAHTPAAPSLKDVLQRRKNVAALLYWHLQQCGQSTTSYIRVQY